MTHSVVKALQEVRSALGSGTTGRLGLDEYQSLASLTYKGDLVGADKTEFLLLGLYGEVGSLLSELKKKQRDRGAYTAYAHSAVEETGDVLWYLANLADVLGVRLSELAVGSGLTSAHHGGGAAFADLEPQAALFEEPASGPAVQRSLLELAGLTGRVVRHAQHAKDLALLKGDLAEVLAAIVSAAQQAHVSLERAATENLVKLLDRWPVRRVWGRLYDDDFHPDERLPRSLEVVFREREVRGTVYAFQSVKGVNVGDRLTDNSPGEDDYRFHDVFHLAFAAILGWSPVLRALLKVKRKSDSWVDEQQDGARAIITEEGISNWIFSHGLRHDAFEAVDSLDFSLLKTVREMVKGYEVHDRPLWMWEHAVLRGFDVFRQLKLHRGGAVRADLLARTLEFTPPVADPSDNGADAPIAG